MKGHICTINGYVYSRIVHGSTAQKCTGDKITEIEYYYFRAVTIIMAHKIEITLGTALRDGK